ncbi:hypothetical protein LTR85_008828 [Meristemomyces frigidus]|nr:hypothetical protein LTR85_008828 [Meristemomyces frigidus]
MASSAGEPAAKRSKPGYADTVTVLVGPEEKSFTVHKDNLCARSRFFQAACAQVWKEGAEKVFRLPEHQPDCFLVYTHCMYTGALDMSLMEELPADVGSTIIPPSFRNLTKVWVLGNYLGDDGICNRVNDRTLEKLDVELMMTPWDLASNGYIETRHSLECLLSTLMKT